MEVEDTNTTNRLPVRQNYQHAVSRRRIKSLEVHGKKVKFDVDISLITAGS